MDAKRSNLLIMGAGAVFILLGINNILHATSWMHYITFGVGIILLAVGAYGYKVGKQF